MKLEIGSEFEYVAPGREKAELKDLFFPEAEDKCFCFCGRTAIETVLADVKSIKKACLPSYCCSSMIEPFHAAGMDVTFYRVVREADGVGFLFDEIPADAELVLYCNYFGFSADFLPKEVISRVHERGGVILEDVTQSLLSDVPAHEESDYLVASLRKWFPTPAGGLAVKRSGRFDKKPLGSVSREFLSPRCEAMRIKERYLRSADPAEKEAYFPLYGEANHWLEANYSGLAADGETLAWLAAADMDEIRRRRRENAEVLFSGLDGIPHVKPLFPSEKMDCPLFLPVTVEKEYRAAVRKALIDRAVYCPVHWPKPQEGIRSELYDMELSLICDQRYNTEDMKRIISVLKEQG